MVWGDTLIQAQASMAMYFISELPNVDYYNWILPEGLSGNSNSNMIQVAVDASFRSGVITVYGINVCGEGEKLEFSVKKEDDTGIEDTFIRNRSCYPNPVKDKLHIRSADLHGINNLAVLYDLTGRPVTSIRLFDSDNELDVKELLSGLYVLRIVCGDQVKHISILKE
jgi:hypothetical protein